MIDGEDLEFYCKAFHKLYPDKQIIDIESLKKCRLMDWNEAFKA